MKIFRKTILFLFLLIPLSVTADTSIRTSIFSTSTDWEGITGLYLSEFNVKFSGGKNLVDKGLELYFLDGFPCFGQTDSARIWIGSDGKTDGKIRITCLFTPEKLKFAWRNAARDATQDKTSGMLECPVTFDDDLKVDLFNCTKGKDWKEYR